MAVMAEATGTPTDQPPREPNGEHLITRRRLLGSAGVVAAAAATGVVGFEVGHRSIDAAPAAQMGEPPAPVATVVPFHGPHQAGIVTPAQDRMHVAAFDLVTSRRGDVMELLKEWTSAAALMTAGHPTGAVAGEEEFAPTDTGEAFGLSAARLTVTVGFGPTLFERGSRDPFGLRHLRPAALIDLPAFSQDRLDPTRSGGDILVQACADDPQVAFHAIRMLARIGRGVAVARWSQLGFGRTSSTSRRQVTPRNLMGFKDGTNNLTGDDEALLRDFVWVGDADEPAWMRGGTYAVTRRIRMLLERWDDSTLDDQEGTIGRVKLSGAPLGRANEFDTVPLAAAGSGGKPLIPTGAHIRVAAPSTNGGVRLLRRGYSFSDGLDEGTGRLDAGLFFVCFQRDPRTQFVPVQRRLAGSDALNQYIEHVGSGIFAVAPGIAPGGSWGETLFAG
jgi:deferrochelatase/peroxidase EfeB